jgi:hypothetical protein
VVLSIASFNAELATLTWSGIGNVEALLVRGSDTGNGPCDALASRGGVVGYQIPRVRAKTLPVCSGDLLVMATDGIKSGFETDVVIDAPPPEIARTVLENHGRGTDDALVTVVRFVEES